MIFFISWSTSSSNGKSSSITATSSIGCRGRKINLASGFNSITGGYIALTGGVKISEFEGSVGLYISY